MTCLTPTRRILNDRDGVPSSAGAKAHGAVLLYFFIRVVLCWVTHPGLASAGYAGQDV